MEKTRTKLYVLTGVAAALAAGGILAVAGCFPVLAVPLSLAAMPALAYGKRLHAATPFAVLTLWGVLALSLNFDWLTLVSLVVTFVACGWDALLADRDNFLLSGAVCGLGAAVAAVAVCGAACLSLQTTPSQLCEDYALQNRDNFVIAHAANRYFDKLETAEEKPPKGTPAYADRAVRAYAGHLRQTMASDFIYYLTAYPVTLALFGNFLFILQRKDALKRRRKREDCPPKAQSRAAASDTPPTAQIAHTSDGGIPLQMPKKRFSAHDDAQAREDAVLGEPAEHAVCVSASKTDFAEMRLGRPFLWTVFVPVLLFSLLGLLEVMQPVVAAAFNITVFLPCAAAGFCLTLYVARLCRGKLKTALTILFVVLGVAAVFVPYVTFALSVFGFCDCLINMRKLFDIVKRA